MAVSWVGDEDVEQSIFIKGAFMKKVRGPSNSNIKKWRKKYGIKIQCMHGDADYLLLIGRQSGVANAEAVIRAKFGQYIRKKRPKVDRVCHYRI